VGEETGKRGNEWWGGEGENEGVDEGEMEGLQLLSLLHTVGFFFISPFQVLSVPFTKPTDSTRGSVRESERYTGRHRERDRGREIARACVRASGFRSIVPTVTLSARIAFQNAACDMAFICSCRNKNRSRAPYTFRKVHTTRGCLGSLALMI